MIQLPDFLMFIYDRIKKIKFFRNVRRPNVVMAMAQIEGKGASTTDAEQQTDSNEDQVSSEGRNILNILSRVEEKLEERLEENDRRLSRMEDNEIKILRKLH